MNTAARLVIRRGVGPAALMAGWLLLSGCVAIPTNYHAAGSRRNLSDQAQTRLQPDVTTKEEVLLSLGEPDFVSEDGQRLGYAWTKVKAIFILLLPNGGAIGEAKRSYVLEISFAPDHRVSQTRVLKQWGPEVSPARELNSTSPAPDPGRAISFGGRRHRWLWARWAALAVTGTRPAPAGPGYGQPLTLTRGTVHEVATVPQLQQALAAANRAAVPATILLADGVYQLEGLTLQITCPGLVIRSARGERDAVIVRGADEGTNAALRNVFLVPATNVVIADLTLGYCRWHGIQAQGETPQHAAGLWVHNCRLVNCNEQFIKGSAGAAAVGARDGLIENCLFEFTSGWAYQYYTGGIDIHKGVNWTVRDNLFRNLRVPAGQPGMAEHAIHFWNRAGQAQNVIVERNWIINCDRGIGFGLGSSAGGFSGGNSRIRNNVVCNDGPGPHTDVGIGLEHAGEVQVDNNTVYVPAYWAPIEYRFAGSTNLLFRNNLVNRPITSRDAAPPAARSNNVENAQPGWFRSVAASDLHLLPAAAPAIDHGLSLEEFSVDWDGQTRPVGKAWDVGADEYDPAGAGR